MLSRNSSATALRRLMTEYKQLTANGSPDDMFTAGATNTEYLLTLQLMVACELGPVSESDFFTWEALISGPKDTPFVSKIVLS
jgi:ubiquitin-conjugating enzyme E2 G2